MTPDSQADLAESLVPVAARLVGAVHDDGPGEIARLLHQVPDGHLRALTVVLAAMVDPDISAAEALAWVTWDDTHPPVPTDTLFGTVVADVVSLPSQGDPRTWSDDKCRDLFYAWRRRQRGNGDPLGNPWIEQQGYREYDRRRKADLRAQRGRKPRTSTRVSSGA